MAKKQYITKQHYIPRFVLRNFVTDNLLYVAHIGTTNVRYFQTTPENICFQNDLYEIKNEDGTCFNRNALEDRFARMEGWFAFELRDLLEKSKNTPQITGEQDAMLALFLAVQLVRLPSFKQLIFGKNDIGTIEKNYLYEEFVNSQEAAISYLNQSNVNFQTKELLDNENKTVIDTVASHLLSNCFFYILDASGIEEKFLIADQPVLIWPFSDAQYIFPVSPNFAVACCPFLSAQGKQVEGFLKIGNEMLNKINALSCEQCNRFVIAKEFTENQKRILERKDDRCCCSFNMGQG